MRERADEMGWQMADADLIVFADVGHTPTARSFASAIHGSLSIAVSA